MSTENQTNVLETLVGEGKKYKTVEDLAKSRLEADAFIDKLKGELDIVRTELSKADQNVDRTKLLENLMSSLTNTTNRTETPPNQPSDSNTNQNAGLSHDDVVKIVEQREREATAQRNLDASMAAFRKVFGDKSDEELAKRATALGMAVEELHSLAKRSPAAFQSVVGLNQTDNSTHSMATRSSVNSLGPSNPGAAPVRNKAYYDALMKQMTPLKFALDAQLQVQLHNDMRRLGDAWDAT
jgi:hypothetical protein